MCALLFCLASVLVLDGGARVGGGGGGGRGNGKREVGNDGTERAGRCVHSLLLPRPPRSSPSTQTRRARAFPVPAWMPSPALHASAHTIRTPLVHGRLATQAGRIRVAAPLPVHQAPRCAARPAPRRAPAPTMAPRAGAGAGEGGPAPAVAIITTVRERKEGRKGGHNRITTGPSHTLPKPPPRPRFARPHTRHLTPYPDPLFRPAAASVPRPRPP